MRELNRFYRSYCQCLIMIGRAETETLKREWTHNAELHATRYNEELKRMGGPSKIKGEFYLSMGKIA